MNNYLKFILISLGCSLLIVCCSKEKELDNNLRIIKFSVNSNKVKTIYDASNDAQINWVEGDIVRIFCAEANDVQMADYSISKKKEKENIGILDVNANGLKWGDYVEHKFYSVYPSNIITPNDINDGVITFTANNFQLCELGQVTNNNYNTTPNMKNAIMVAHNVSLPDTNYLVGLVYSPIMTTLKIVVRGRPTGNTIITGVSIHFDNNNLLNKGKFNYNAKTKKLEPWENIISTRETIFVGIKYVDNNGTNLNSVELKSNETITLTAFLPPIPINESNPIKIMVHTPGNSSPIVTEKRIIMESSKCTITLSELPENNGVNNWITPLDDNIYVSQLSIPGSHDTGTGHGTVTDSYRTQDKTFEQQWNLGIRAFDIRAAHSNGWFGAPNVKSWDQIVLWHGIYRTYARLKEDIIDVCLNKLQKYPNEFVVLQLKNEDGDKDKWSQWIGDMMVFLKKNYPQNVLVSFKKDLTLKEVRGKILFLARNINNEEPYYEGPTGAYINTFPDNTKGLLCKNALFNNVTADIYIQDYYKPGSDVEGKRNAVKNAINFSIKTNKDINNINCWTINFLSGYTGIVSTNSYRDNAQNVNPEIYKYITNEQFLAGPLGMCMMDWVGSRTSNNYSVFGDLLPQAIIDNNYKSRLNRKGEN